MNKLTLLRQKDGYSIYKNPDKDLKKAIKNIEDPTELTEFWVPEFRDDKWSFKETLENGSILLQSNNGNLTTISKKEYDYEFKESKLQKINRTYSVGDLMNRYFMPMYIGQKIYHKMFSQPLKIFGTLQESFYDGVNSISIIEEYHMSDYGYNTSFEASFGNGNGHMYFNLNGDIENRDYNQDLNETSKFIPKEVIIEDFIQVLDRRIGDSVLEVSNKNLNYFIDGYAFKIKEDSTEIEVEYYPHSSGNRYFQPGESYRKITKPAKLNIIAKDEFLNLMREKCNNLKQNKFWEWTQEND